MIFLWLTHPTKPIDVFRHLEKERFAGVSECVSTQARYTVLYTRRPFPPPTKVQSEGFPPKRPCSVLGAAFGSSRERREGNERTNASFALSSQQHCRILPPALDVTNYSNWCGDLKELRRVLPPPSSPFVWGSLAAPRHLQNLQHSFNSPSPSPQYNKLCFFSASKILAMSIRLTLLTQWMILQKRPT